MHVPSKITPVILCGGAGTRHVPVHPPKQFQGETPMMIQTIQRFQHDAFTAPLIVGCQSDNDILTSQLNAHAIQPLGIILEPERKNTAAAMVQACLKSNPQDMLLFLPIDHHFDNEAAFINAILSVQPNNQITCFGVSTTRPDTQVGYINPIGKKFHEKPLMKIATLYAHDPTWFYNCGIYLAKSGVMIQEFRIHASEILSNIDDYNMLEPISFDHAIMERTENFNVTSLDDCGWRDIGVK